VCVSALLGSANPVFASLIVLCQFSSGTLPCYNLPGKLRAFVKLH
jgi:hypothetical protein